MVYEHFLRCFILEDPSLGFSKLFQTIIACGDMPRSMVLVLEVGKLLVMTKDNGGLCPIVISEVFH
jgi:hypothetical protein